MIEAQGLTKRFRSAIAVDDLSFTVEPGRVTAFLGPNGAGKSTTVRMILGLASPDRGRALVTGRSYASIRWPLREVGALVDASAVHPGRSAGNHLRWIARSNRIPDRRVGQVLEQTGLSSVAKQRVGGFSLGMKQRLGIAAALIGDPPVLIFDEPINGMDPEGIHWIRGQLKMLAGQGRTVLFSSHVMSEVEQSADHLIIIGRGHLIADTSMAAFIRRNVPDDVFVRSPRISELADHLRGRGATVVPNTDFTVSVTGLDAAAIAEVAALHQLPLYELTTRRASLEQAYLQLTDRDVQFRAVSSAEPKTSAQELS